MIELAILGLVSDQDLHGYELKKQLAELLGPWSSVSFGSLYPALARLEKAGHIQALTPAAADEGSEPTTPMTGALSGELAAFRSSRRTASRSGRTKAGIGRRGKKVYGVTDTGRARVHELLTGPGPDDERSFSIRVAFCQQLTSTERLLLFERRRAELNSMIATRRSALTGPGSHRSDPYRRLLRDRDTRSLTNDLLWIDELVAATGSEVPSTGARSPIPEPDPDVRSGQPVAVAPPTLPRPPFSGSIIDPSPKAGTQP